jgi:hypothetical protein
VNRVSTSRKEQDKKQPSLQTPLHLFLLIGVILIVSACTDETIIKKICSKNTTYCEDIAKTNGYNSTSWENLSTVLDSRSTNNQTYWENLT